jgi:uncharacterized protein YecT (DUF1311 family)
MRAAQVLLGPLLVAAVANAHPAAPLEDCTDRSPTLAGIHECLDQIFQQTDAELRVRGKAVLVLMRRIQKQTRSPKAPQTFILAQNQFRAFRKAQCDWSARRAPTEPRASWLRQDCLIRLTQERSAELAALLPGGEAGLEQQEGGSFQPDDATQTLFDVEWRLVRVRKHGLEVPLPRESRLSLVLTEGGSAGGRTRAGLFSGRYALRDGGRIEWLQQGFSLERNSGRFDAPDPDEAILDDLVLTTRLRLDVPGLVLQSEDGSVSLGFAR